MNRLLERKDVLAIKNFVIDSIEHSFEPKSITRVVGASVSKSDSTDTIKIIIHKLSEFNEQLDRNIFSLPIERELTDFGVFTCETSKIGMHSIRNPRSLLFSYSNDKRIQDIKNLFKSAVKQLPKSGPGQIHIRLPVNSWTTDLNKTIDNATQFLQKELTGGNNRRVNAVIVSMYYTELLRNGTFRIPVYKMFPLIVEHDNPRTGFL